MNCAIYVRKSKIVADSDSMNTQIAMCLDYLDKKYGSGNYSYTVYDKDYGITGHAIKPRKDFQRMMKDVADRRINLVVVQRYDRLSRNTRDFCNTYHEMEQVGCELVSVSQQIDTSTPYGKNFMYMQASMAELEWALNSERRKDNNRYAISIGKYVGSVPIGYVRVKVDGIGRLFIDESKRAMVQDIWKHFGMYTNYSATARYINQKYGTDYGMIHIKRIIHNMVYKGEYYNHSNYCEAYVDEHEWNRLQTKNPCITPRQSEHAAGILFGGLLLCPECGRRMRCVAKTKPNGKKYRYYKCEYHSQGRCPCNKVKAQSLIEQMLMDNMDQYVESVKQTVQLKQTQTTRDQVSSLRAELDRLNTMYQKGRISDEKYDIEYDRIKKEIDEQSQSDVCNISKLEKAFTGNWKELYSNLDDMHKRIFWRSIIKNINFNHDMTIKSVSFL